MKALAPFLLLATALATPSLAVADARFDANLALARQNLATPAGAAYDRRLGEAAAQIPALAEGISACLRAHPGNHDVQGYFHFESAQRYTVALAPSGPFATCLTQALEGQVLPAPPTLPWFNHFTLQNTDPAAGSSP